MSSEVGVLALQGCVTPHLELLKRSGIKAKAVRSDADLKEVERLILPGGESSTMLKLLHSTGLFSSIIKFAQNHALWGICAGAILLAKEVKNPSQESLGLIDISAERNSYGSQLDSFESEIEVEVLSGKLKTQFIRAPRLKALNPEVEMLAQLNGDPVLLKQGRIMVSSFHVELGEDARLHNFFLGI